MTVAADMDLRAIFPQLEPPAPPVDVIDIATHSDDVVAGGLFMACAGRGGHGLRFLGRALERGARAVAWEPRDVLDPPRLPDGVCGLQVPLLGDRLGEIANRFFGDPSAEVSVTGITGTNGKTTVAWLLTQALDRLGRAAGYIGTLGWGSGDRVRDTGLTTPDCVTLHRRLRELAAGGATDVAVEVSSHALDQKRTAGVTFRTVAFTNLSRDHLDYHADMASYGRAKERLFLDSGAATAVINLDDEFGRALAAQLPAATRLVAVSAGGAGAGAATVRAGILPGGGAGMRIALYSAGEQTGFTTALAGGFNVENLAITAGILLSAGFGLERIGAVLAGCSAPPGRMEVITAERGPRVVVDFAHTPDALARVLSALRAPAPSRLWCVFGCGGERDSGKREAMGRVARSLADCIIVTDDNPRHEDPEAIVAAVLRGTGTGSTVRVMRDRAAAIGHAIAAARSGDVVLIAGKGHEAVQIVGDEQRTFSDQAVARAALAGRS